MLPNIITSIRLVLTVPFLISLKGVVISGNSSVVPVSLFILIILSDFLDGFIARRVNKVSDFGAGLDIAADSFYTLSSMFLLSYLEVIPFWFPLLLCFKLFEFVVTSKFLQCDSYTSFVPVFDKLGKIAACTSMALPGIVCIGYDINSYFIYLITTMFILSSLNRFVSVKGVRFAK